MILMRFDLSRLKKQKLLSSSAGSIETLDHPLNLKENGWSGRLDWVTCNPIVDPCLSCHLSVPITAYPTPSLPCHGHSHNESICLVLHSCLPLVSHTLLWKAKPCCPRSHLNYKLIPQVWVRSSVAVLRIQSVLGAKLKSGLCFNFMAPHHTFYFCVKL